jgi:hypothetical protein
MRYNNMPRGMYFVVMKRVLGTLFIPDIRYYMIFQNRLFITTTEEIRKIDWQTFDNTIKQWQKDHLNG